MVDRGEQADRPGADETGEVRVRTPRMSFSAGDRAGCDAVAHPTTV